MVLPVVPATAPAQNKMAALPYAAEEATTPSNKRELRGAIVNLFGAATWSVKVV